MDEIDEVHQRLLLRLNGFLLQRVRNRTSGVDSLMDGTESLSLASFIVLLEGLGVAFVTIAVDELLDLRNGEDIVVREVEFLCLIPQLLFLFFTLLLGEILNLLGALSMPVVGSRESVLFVLIHDLLRDRVDGRVESEFSLFLLFLFLFDQLMQGDLLGFSVAVKLLGIRICVLRIDALGI